MELIDGKVISFRIEKADLDLIDKYAAKMRMPRSQLIRNLIHSSLDDVKLMEKTGILSLAAKGRDLLDMVRSSLHEDRYEVSEDKLIIEL